MAAVDHNRTWLASIVFLDIVGYSKRPVEQQIDIKNHLNAMIAESIERVAARDRIMIDAGDGVALCYLGDPEEALFMAMNLCDELKEANKARKLTYDMRVGINLGPIKVVKDINGRQNALGDGINVAQRVMGFAGDNQILVSRSFFEVIGCLSKEYEDLFHYQGVHKDKHVREHEVYEVGLKATGNGAQVTLMPHTGAGGVALEGDTAPQTDELPGDTGSGASPPQALRWNPAILKRARDALTPHIGPLASILVKKAAQRTSSAEDLYSYLADSIPGADDRSAFLSNVATTEEPIAIPASERDRAATNMAIGSPDTGDPPSGSPAPVFDGLKLEAMAARLTPYVGPLSKVLVKKTAKKASSYDELREMLAAEIDDESQRNGFLAAVKTIR